jgi:hypothetical protein
MATYVITFLGLNPKLAVYDFQGDKITAEVFPQALMEVMDFDRMYVCVTALVKERTFPILAKLNDDRIEAVEIEDGEETAQMWKNFNTIVSKFQPQDKVIFDITHAARSIPFLTFLFSAYLKVAKQVEIVDVYYGALVFANPPPIVAHSPQPPQPATVIKMGGFVSMLDWMSATERFIDLGDGNKLVELLKSITEKAEDSSLKTTIEETASAIAQVSDALIYILPIEVMSAAAKLKKIIPKLREAGKEYSELKPFLLLGDLIQIKYQKLALDRPDSTSNLVDNFNHQLAIIDWYQAHQQEVKAIVLSRELFISILKYWLREGDNVFDGYDARKNAEKILNRKEYNSEFYGFPSRNKIIKRWNQSKKLRNNIAHLGMDKNCGSIESIKSDINTKINDIKVCLKEFLKMAKARNI